jgi:hypothetical protein
MLLPKREWWDHRYPHALQLLHQAYSLQGGYLTAGCDNLESRKFCLVYDHLLRPTDDHYDILAAARNLHGIYYLGLLYAWLIRNKTWDVASSVRTYHTYAPGYVLEYAHMYERLLPTKSNSGYDTVLSQ